MNKNKHSARFLKVFVLVILLLMLQQQQAIATNYYINSKNGNDGNKGSNLKAPWKTSSPLATTILKPGDSILFASGQSFSGMLTLENVKGNAGHPVVISSYLYNRNIAKPILDAGIDLNTIWLKNSSHVKIEGLEITGAVPYPNNNPPSKSLMRCGILIEQTQNEWNSNIDLNNLVIHDVYFNPKGFIRNAEEVKTANGTQSYGWGVRFINNTTGGKLTNINVSQTEIYNVSHTGLKFTSTRGGMQNVVVANCKVHHTGGPGIQLSGVQDGHIHHNKIDHSGSKDDSRNWARGSGLWTWGCSNILIEHNRFENANGPGDSAGIHIDYNCSDVIVQYNFSANNAGGFCEILGNNFNCAYRYNISVNDGYRIKGKDGAFQEGKVFWLSGFQGDKQPPVGPFNSYFYNNTIYVDSTITPKISISNSANGILVANNIFYFEKDAIIVTGDQKKNEEATYNINNVVFTNNLFLRKDTWPQQFLKDKLLLTGDPLFRNKGGLTAGDYKIMNDTLVRNKGIGIQKIPGDTKGLIQGLQLKNDMMGNPVIGVPDIGAIENDKEKSGIQKTSRRKH